MPRHGIIDRAALFDSYVYLIFSSSFGCVACACARSTVLSLFISLHVGTDWTSALPAELSTRVRLVTSCVASSQEGIGLVIHRQRARG